MDATSGFKHPHLSFRLGEQAKVTGLTAIVPANAGHRQFGGPNPVDGGEAYTHPLA